MPISQQSALAESIPHSPSLEKPSNSEYRQAYLSKVRDWRDATRNQAIAAYRASPEYDRVNQYIRFLENESWDKRRPSYRSNYRNNKVGLTRRDRLAKMGDVNPTITISTVAEAYQVPAEVLENTIRAEWNRQNWSQTLVTLYDLALLHGTSFAKVGAGPDKLSLTALGPDQVIPIQPKMESIQFSAAILHRSMQPISYFHRKFPFSSAGIERYAKATGIAASRTNRPEYIDRTTWEGLSGGMRRILGVRESGGFEGDPGNKYYGMVDLEEYYVEDYSRNESNHDILMKDPYLSLEDHNWHYIVRPGERLYPRKRLIIFGGDKLLYDGPSPFWHGMYPFAALWCNKVPWSFYGLSLYRDLVPMQKLLNEIPAGISDMIAKALNPPLITKAGAIGPNEFRSFASDLPGARLILNNNVQEIEKAFVWQKPPEIPVYVSQMIQGVLNPEFDKLAGTVDIMSLSQKNQMAGGDTIDTMRDSLQTSLKMEEKHVETFLNDAGKLALSNVIQFFSSKRRMQLLGEDGLTDQDFLFDPGTIYPGTREYGSKFWQMFALQVQPGSLNSNAKANDKMEAIGLVSRGLISRQEFFRRMKIPRDKAEQILNEMMQEGATVQAMINGGGGGVPSGPNGGGAGGTRTPRNPDDKNEGQGV